MPIAQLLLQFLHEILVVLPVVVVPAVGQRRVDERREHVDQCRKQVAATQTTLTFVDTLPGQPCYATSRDANVAPLADPGYFFLIQIKDILFCKV